MRKIILALIFSNFIANACFAGSLTSSLDEEAYEKGREYFSKRIIFCNGKYYMKGLSLIEIEGLDFFINPREISEADRKNGIEWSGRFSFEARTYREIGENFEWGIYKDWNSQLGRLSLPEGIFDNSIGMLKLNGIWYLNEEPNKEKFIGLNKFLYEFQKKEEMEELNISCGAPPEYILGEFRKKQVESLIWQGAEAISREDGWRAVQYYEQAYAIGSLQTAGGLLGQMLLKGLRVPKNEMRGVALTRRAAEQSDQAAVQRHAQYCLWQMYRDGTGVPEDSRKAVAWLQKAAEQGYPDAQFELGLLYEAGGIRDQQQAFLWFNKALDSFKELAKRNDSRAQMILGTIYFAGKTGDPDYGQAIKWFEKSVENDSGSIKEGARVALIKIYSSCRDPRFHNGQLAVRQAQELCHRLGARSEYLELLATAYARNGQFDKAVSTQREAIGRLSREKMTEARRGQKLSRLQQRLALYLGNEAYVDEGTKE